MFCEQFVLNQECQHQHIQITIVILMANHFFLNMFFVTFFVKIWWVMYSEMHIWCYNTKNYCIKHTKKWDVKSFQIDGQAFTSSYLPQPSLFSYLQSSHGQYLVKIGKNLLLSMLHQLVVPLDKLWNKSEHKSLVRFYT